MVQKKDCTDFNTFVQPSAECQQLKLNNVSYEILK